MLGQTPTLRIERRSWSLIGRYSHYTVNYSQYDRQKAKDGLATFHLDTIRVYLTLSQEHACPGATGTLGSTVLL